MKSTKDKKEKMKRALEALHSVASEKPVDSTHYSETKNSFSERYLEARSLALRKIGIARSTSSGKVIRHLRDNDLSPELIEQVIEDLNREGYLDDERCCRRIIARHQGSRAKSRAMMKMLFVQQGIDQNIAQKVADTLEDDFSKLSMLRDKEGEMTKEESLKWARKMLGRGFPNHLIMDVIREAADEK